MFPHLNDNNRKRDELGLSYSKKRKWERESQKDRQKEMGRDRILCHKGRKPT